MSTADTIRDQTIQAIEKSASEGWRVCIKEAPGYFDIQRAILTLRAKTKKLQAEENGIEFQGQTSEGKHWGVLLVFSPNRKARK
jgi:hypothetical protein